MIARKIALVAAALTAAGTFSVAPASANCIEIEGVGCVNPCMTLAPIVYKLTGEDLVCTA